MVVIMEKFVNEILAEFFNDKSRPPRKMVDGFRF